MKYFSQIFFSDSSKMHKLRAVVNEVAKADITVLIRGESGTGKEIIAQAIHYDSHRREKPFIKVNCAAIPKTLLESELFGFEKGAFTGAYLQKPGKFELANEGTILLNDIGEMEFSIQAKLLQVLQDGEFSRLGGDQSFSLDTRVITTTKDHLEKSVLEGRFRQDLFYRVNVITLTVPPLRDRREQILPLAHYYLDFYRQKYEKSIPALSPESIRTLQNYFWPGNVRELENVIKRLVLFGDEETVFQDLIHNQTQNETGDGSGLPGIKGMEKVDLKDVGKRAAETAEKKVIQSTLEETHWNRKEAAKLLRVSYKALLYKIQKYGLDELKICYEGEEEV